MSIPVTAVLPYPSDIPIAFQSGKTKARALLARWEAHGLAGIDLVAQPGVDRQQAIDAIETLLQLPREDYPHKPAAMAYLLSQWFVVDDAVWTKGAVA